MCNSLGSTWKSRYYSGEYWKGAPILVSNGRGHPLLYPASVFPTSPGAHPARTHPPSLGAPEATLTIHRGVCNICLFDLNSIPHYSRRQLPPSSCLLRYPGHTPNLISFLLYADTFPAHYPSPWPRLLPSLSLVSP